MAALECSITNYAGLTDPAVINNATYGDRIADEVSNFASKLGHPQTVHLPAESIPITDLANCEIGFNIYTDGPTLPEQLITRALFRATFPANPSDLFGSLPGTSGLTVSLLQYDDLSDPATINNDTYTGAIASELAAFANKLGSPQTVFLPADDTNFPDETVNTSWVDVWVVTIGSGPSAQPAVQCTCGMMAKYIVDPSKLFGNLP